MFKHFYVWLAALTALGSCAYKVPKKITLPLLIGTYTEKLGHVEGTASGIYTADFDPQTGLVRLTDSLLNIANPSFLTLAPNGQFLYAVAETGGKPTQPLGEVQAFVHTEGGRWKPLNKVSSRGIAPCFVSVSATGQTAYVANYVTGHALAYRLTAQGQLGDTLPLEGTVRGGWAHYFKETPDGKHAIWVDKGVDKLFVFRVLKDKLVLNQTVDLPQGAGPRHLDFHPNGRFCYIINELNNTVVAAHFDPILGKMALVQTVSTLPEGYKAPNTGADIHVSPDGHWLMASNRGHNSLALFQIDTQSGGLTAQGFLPAEGLIPRNFIFSPDGQVLVAHQNSHSIAVFEQKQGQWRLKKLNTGIPTPVCLAFGRF